MQGSMLSRGSFALRLLRVVRSELRPSSSSSSSSDSDSDVDSRLAKAIKAQARPARTRPETEEDRLVRDQVNAVQDIVDQVSDKERQAQMKSDLLISLQSMEKDGQDDGVKSVPVAESSIVDLMAGMDLRASEASDSAVRRGGEFESAVRSRPLLPSATRRARTAARVEVEAGEPIGAFFSTGPGLGIFPEASGAAAEESVWSRLERARYQAQLDRGPTDGLDQLRRWTQEGKLWPYPIDNEWRAEEADVGFQEHVFLLERLDQMDLPKDGPIRKFMEIVAVGLSKNPYMPAAKKHKHLDWYQSYFKEKEDFIMKLHDGSSKKATATESPQEDEPIAKEVMSA